MATPKMPTGRDAAECVVAILNALGWDPGSRKSARETGLSTTHLKRWGQGKIGNVQPETHQTAERFIADVAKREPVTARGRHARGLALAYLARIEAAVAEGATKGPTGDDGLGERAAERVREKGRRGGNGRKTKDE